MPYGRGLGFGPETGVPAWSLLQGGMVWKNLGRAAHMIYMTTLNDQSRENFRNADGTFGEQPKTEPEVRLPVTLTYAQEMHLGMRAPTNENAFQDRFDADRDYRPTRPYLALTVADDDEFFDAPEGAVLEVVRPDGNVERHVRDAHVVDEGWTWHRMDDPKVTIQTGELWGSLFHDTEMDSAQVIMPPGRYFENWQSTGESPLSAEVAREWLGRSKWEMTSRYINSDELQAGTRPSDRGAHSAVIDDDGEFVSFGDSVFPIREGMLFERDGDLVIRRINDGYGFEYAFRPQR